MRHTSSRLLLTSLPLLAILASGCGLGQSYQQYPGPSSFEQQPRMGLGSLLFPSVRTMPTEESAFQQDYENKLTEVQQLRAENQRLRQLLNPPATHQALPSRPGPDLSPRPPAGIREVEVEGQPGNTLPADSLPSLDQPVSVPVEPLSTSRPPAENGSTAGSDLDLPIEVEELASEWSARRGDRSPSGLNPRVANPMPTGQIPLPAGATEDFPIPEGWQR